MPSYPLGSPQPRCESVAAPRPAKDETTNCLRVSFIDPAPTAAGALKRLHRTARGGAGGIAHPATEVGGHPLHQGDEPHCRRVDPSEYEKVPKVGPAPELPRDPHRIRDVDSLLAANPGKSCNFQATERPSSPMHPAGLSTGSVGCQTIRLTDPRPR